jgi:hypothetical protein
MLYLNPPYVVVNGLTAYPDHADPLQWYYLPEQPRLSVRVNDSGQEIPAFSLLRFRSAAGHNGGMLSFDVDLRVDDDVLAEAASGIRSALRLPALPRLAPVQLEDGTVSLTVLGQKDDASSGTEPAPDDSRRFVVKVAHAAKPSLYGTNRAAFSVELDQDSSVLVEKSLDGELTPIGVVYSLTFLGLRPAYSVRLNIDWDRMQDRLNKEFGVDQLFVSTQISEAVDKLIDERVIDLQVDTFVPEGEDTKSIITSRDRAVSQVRDMITDAFFTASIDPRREPPDGWDKATEMLDSFHRNAASAGGLLPHFSYNSTHYTKIDRKRLDVTMSERVTVARSIYPQAHLSGIAAGIRASGLPRTPTFVNDIDLDDPWYQRRRVRVLSRVNTGTGHISSVTASLTYHGDVETVVIDGPDDHQDVHWASVLTGGRMDMPVQASVAVHLAPVEDLQRPSTITGPAQLIDSEVWEVRTDDLFRLETVPIRTDGVPWDRWSAVEVTLRYADPEHDVHQQSTIELSADVPGWNHVLFVMAGGPTSFDYRVRYRGRDGRQDVQRDWVSTDEGEIRIRDPFPAKRTITVIPQVNWSEVDRMLVDLSYQDPARGVRYDQALEFSTEAKATQTFSVDLQDPLQRRVGWQATILYTDGRSVNVGPSVTTETRLIIRPDLPRHRVVQVSADLARDRTLREVLATVSPVGSDTVLAELTFTAGSPPQEFGFDHASDTDTGFRYRLTYRYQNGLTKTKDWTETRATELAIGPF